MGFRLRFWVLRVVALAVALGVCLAPAVARAATVVNGGFETGDFTGWHEQDQAGSAGSWQVYSGTSSPLNGFTIPAPPQGMFAAITDQTKPASNILYQDVALEAGAKHTLSLYVYYTSQAPIANPPTLDYTTSFPNQQFRIDVMKPSAPLTSVNPSDILLTVFATKTGDPESLSPTLIKVDLTPFAGQTVRLRFAQVDNQFFNNAGFDDVTIASTPAATTAPASGVTVGGATLNGTVNPAGSETSYHFEYGTTTAYGTSVPVSAAAVGSDSTVHSVSQAISGLSPGSTYHYRIVATNDNGTTDGADMTFTTTAAPPKAVPPTVTTGAARNLAHTSATLHGRVNPNGSATSYHFQYGTSTHFGKQTSVKSAGSGTITQSASAPISGLAPDTTYHYRVVAVNAAGTSDGADHTFKTPARPLRLTVSPARVPAGTRACVTFRATSTGRPVAGAAIHLAGHSKHTSHAGKTTICLRLHRGIHRASATKHTYHTTHASIIATAATKPSFTG